MEQDEKSIGGGIRWQWVKLAQAMSKEDVQAALVGFNEVIGERDMHVTLHIPAKGYARLAGNAWLAHRYGEIETCNAQNVIDRALGMYDLYLKQKAVGRRRLGLLGG